MHPLKWIADMRLILVVLDSGVVNRGGERAADGSSADEYGYW